MIYVGEAENLARRIRDYIHPGSKRTAKRIKVRLDEERRNGSRIELDTLKFEPFSILIDRATDTHELISVDRLSNPFIRKMMENIGVIVHDARYCEILNKAPNQMERRRGKALKLTKAVQAMTPEERASYYAKFDLKGS